MAQTLEVIVFDVNETLSDMSPIAERFVEAGAPAYMAKLWFATLLRDGFALAATGDAARFADIGTEILTGLLEAAGVADPEGTARRLASSVADLPLHPDVPDAIRALRATGYRLVTLTNGAAQVAENLFAMAGLRGEFEQLLSVEDAPAWKPHPSSYRYAAQRCGVREQEMLLVAAHPWDIHGAARGGLRTAWVNRAGAPYPSYLARPEATVTSLAQLPSALAGTS
ncbi:haloacid dehalogenase type II [Arthrobacter sp. M4]|uniref:haloacid dehalogenase type II n=1 Tax=Arthrobacter sp. M4 TaxID=218160 RepID=UPI001CDB5D49|nr:haloacid dehalogenase type II [Arthrobacter sp. M4]MCA4135635.1 haloacid dehalogenase type II [Arthrobacter sp. M4]